MFNQVSSTQSLPASARRIPPYVLGLIAGIAAGAAMLPYTVIIVFTFLLKETGPAARASSVSLPVGEREAT